MKGLHLPALSAVAPALLIFASQAEAQQRPVGGGPRIDLPPSQSNLFSWERGRGFNHRSRALRQARDKRILIVEREVPVIVEREVVREVPVVIQPVAPPPPRKPYVIGSIYSSLPPQGCMKLIEEEASYYYCNGGEWYRQTGKLYRAVARKL